MSAGAEKSPAEEGVIDLMAALEQSLKDAKPTPCPSCGCRWFHKEGCRDDH